MVHDTSQDATATSHVRVVESIMAYQGGEHLQTMCECPRLMVGIINQPSLSLNITGSLVTC